MPLKVVTCCNRPIACDLLMNFTAYIRNFKEDYNVHVQANKGLSYNSYITCHIDDIKIFARIL